MFNVSSIEKSRAIVTRAKPLLEQNGKLIRRRETFEAPRLSLLARMESSPVNVDFYRFYVKADGFFATDSCIGCGFCAEACLLNNIRLRDGKLLWGRIALTA